MALIDKLGLNNGANKILINSGYLFFEKFLNLGLSFIVSIYVIRYLGPEDYGLWQYSVSLIALTLPFGRLGTPHLAIRDLVLTEEQAQKRKILGSMLTLMLSAGLAGSILISIISFNVNPDRIVRILILIASTELIFQGLEVFDYWFQSKVLSKYSVIAKSTAQVAITLLKVIFVFFDLGLILISVTIIIGGIIRGTLYIIFYVREDESIFNWEFDKEYAMDLLRNSWPLIISGLSLAIYMKIDQVMIRNMLGDIEVGNYAVAAKLSEIWYFIPMSIISSVFPSIINSKKESILKYNKRMQYLYNIMAFIAFCIALPMTFLSDFVVNLLFGDEFIEAGNVLSIHIWAGIFVFMGVARSKWIVNENFQFYGMIFNITGAIVNVLLNLFLIPEFGIIGAAWTTVISLALSGWLLAVCISKTRIAFKMSSKALLNMILVYPAVKSVKQIYQESNRKG